MDALIAGIDWQRLKDAKAAHDAKWVAHVTSLPHVRRLVMAQARRQVVRALNKILANVVD